MSSECQRYKLAYTLNRPGCTALDTRAANPLLLSARAYFSPTTTRSDGELGSVGGAKYLSVLTVQGAMLSIVAQMAGDLN